MDPVTLLMALSSLSLSLKDLVSEKQSQKEDKETDWFRKSLNHKLQEIHETTGVSESILSEVLEKINTVHSKLEQKNVKDDMMMEVLKSYIDHDVKEILEGDLCDQQKWILFLTYNENYRYTQSMNSVRWLPEPEFENEDLRKLCEKELLWESGESYFKLTRKGKDSVERGFIFTTHWTFTVPASGETTDLPISSSNLQLLEEKKKELEKGTKPDWSLNGITTFDDDWLKFERVNGVRTVCNVKNGNIEFK